ncbi:TolC family protein [Phytobacter massiliensis]|uniref:TolC family protein n=1 Tax=Phytobacter massiliensis TaxID=1485952 RepID=UPI0002D9002C|nr:TolC family protein [Phytobacter massiliensis]
MKHNSLSLRAGGVLLCLICSAAKAEPLTLTQTLAAAERYSAELSASRNEARALDAMAESARQLPDPKLKFGIDNLPVQGNNDRRFTREGMTMQRVGVMQRYVSDEKRQRKALTLQAQARSVNAQSAVTRAALQREAAQAWLELAISTRALDTARRLLAESAAQQGAQKASVGAGSASADSVLVWRLALSAMRDKVTLAERDVELAQARLAELTGQNVTAASGSLPRYQRLPADEQTLKEGVAQHPEMVAAASVANSAKARSAESAIAAIPDVDVEVWYGRRAQEYEDMAGVMFTVDLPLFTSQRQDKDHAADLSRSMQANDRLAQTTREHQAQIRTLIANYRAAQALWQRQREEVTPLVRQRAMLLAAQYRAGQTQLPELLEARRAVLDSELSTLQAEKDLARAWAAIQWLIPQELAQ